MALIAVGRARMLVLIAIAGLLLGGVIGAPIARAAAPIAISDWTAKKVDLPVTAAAYVPRLHEFVVVVNAQHPSLGNELVEIDPSSGQPRRHVFVGDHPTNIAVSDDGLVAYVGFHGTNRIARVDLVTFIPTYFPLVPADYGLMQVEDLAVVPGRNDILVASLSFPFTTPRDAGVWAYKNGKPLPKHTGPNNSPTVIEMADASTIYGYTMTYSAEDFWQLTLDQDGVSLVKQTKLGLGNRVIKMAGSSLVTNMGEVIDPDQVTTTQKFDARSTYSGVAPQPDRDLITFYSGGSVLQFRLSTGQLLRSGTNPSLQVPYVSDIVAGGEQFAVISGDALSESSLYLMGPSTNSSTIHYPPTALSTLDAMHERLVPVHAVDLVFDVLRNVIYASVPANADDPHANQVVAIDRATGTVTRELNVGGDPAALAITDDHLNLYVSLRGTGEIVRIGLLTFSEIDRFSVGTVASEGFAPEPVIAEDLQPELLSDNTLVVTLVRPCCSPAFKAVAVFQNGERLPDMVTGFQGPTRLTRGLLGKFYAAWGENGTGVSELRTTLTGVESVATHFYSAYPMYDVDLALGIGVSGGGVVFDPSSDLKIATPGYAGEFEVMPLLGRAYELQNNFVREYELPQWRQIAVHQLSPAIRNYYTVNTMISTGLGLAGTVDEGVVLLDYSLCGGVVVTIKAVGQVTKGTEGDDVILGTDATDVIDGGGGNDIICGLGGDDALVGGAGNDTLLGDAGRDRLLGGLGDDVLDGGDGLDAVFLGTDAVTHVVDLDDVADDGVVGEHDNVRPTNEIIVGSPGPDLIVGTTGPQLLRGAGGNDVLDGGAGDDALDGGPGNDRLNGSAGRDVCAGGLGLTQLLGCEA